jgi:hypothetical protein
MNTLELAYTVTILRRLTESANHYRNDHSWGNDLGEDLKTARALLSAYDKRLVKQFEKDNSL